MMCDICGIRPAKFHLVTVVGTDRTEQDLCPLCMAQKQKQIPGLKIPDLADMISNMLTGQTKEPEPELPDGIFDGLSCDQCGMTYQEFKKGKNVGCARCYKTFKAALVPTIKRIQGSLQHSGRVPEGDHGSVSLRMSIDRLKEKLKEAVANEEYEQAARLRDAIRSLQAQIDRKNADIKVQPQARIPSEEGGDDA